MSVAQVEVLIIEKNESSLGRRSTTGKSAGEMQFGKRSSSAGSASQPINGSSQRSVDSATRQNLLASVIEHGSGRRSLSELSLVDQNPLSGNVSLRKQFHNEEEYNTTVRITKSSEDVSSILQVTVKASFTYLLPSR